MLKKLVQSSLPSLAIRGSTLLLRFALSFYVVGQLGLVDAGIYGLAIGVFAIVPAAVGWGLNYFMIRDVVGHTPETAAALIRDRLVITLISLSIGTLIAVPLAVWQGNTLTLTLFLIVILAWLETLALDIYMPLIGLELSFLANVLVLVRSALWIPVVIALGLYVPAFKTLDMIFLAWTLGHVMANIILFLYLRRWNMSSALRTRMDLAVLGRRAKRSWYIYFSDLGIVGLGYTDRFIVNLILGLTQTGIYTFYFSITNSLQTLVATAVVQLALPRMVRAFKSGDQMVWRDELRRQMVKTFLVASALSVMIFLATEAIFFFSPEGKFPVERLLLLIMLLAAIIRSGSDLLNVSITSMMRDRVYAISNVFGAVLAIAFGAGFMLAFGLIGAGLSAAATAIALFLFRLIYLKYALSRQAASIAATAA